MTEEYMTSVELTREIANLKMRLALQIEYEKELDDVLAEAASEEKEADSQTEEMNRQTLLRIDNVYAEAKKKQKSHISPRRTGKFVLIAAALLIICFGSAFAAVRMVQVGILKINMERYQAYTIFELVPTEENIEVPEIWEGDFYPEYIPNEYKIENASSNSVGYIDSHGKMLTILETTQDARTYLDTENAIISYGRINGYNATLIEKGEWVTVVWSNNSRFFMVDMQGDKDTAVRIAESFIYIR